jgi:hypothetical protein
MANNDTIVHINENSPEYVAYRLMHDVRMAEKSNAVDKKWILDTYAECIRIVRAPGTRGAAAMITDR